MDGVSTGSESNNRIIGLVCQEGAEKCPNNPQFPEQKLGLYLVDSDEPEQANPQTFFQGNGNWQRMKTTESQAEFIADVRNQIAFLENDLDFDTADRQNTVDLSVYGEKHKESAQNFEKQQGFSQNCLKTFEDGHKFKNLLVDNGWCHCVDSEDEEGGKQ